MLFKLYCHVYPLCGVHIFVTQQVFVGLVDLLHFMGFDSTQSNNFMLKYSTDVYFIPINICPLPLLDHSDE